MSDVVIVSGSGPYADPWHQFPITSGEIASIIESLGYTVEIREDVEAALSQPGTHHLLVVNIGNPAEPRPQSAVNAAAAGLLSHLHSGGSLLGVHVSSTSMTGMPQWRTMLGGHWVPGRSMHPAQDHCTIKITGIQHPITEGLGDFTVYDERYSFLQTQSDITVLAEHRYDGTTHPLVWVRQTPTARVVYDALGHDSRSYESEGHRALLRRSVQWLMATAHTRTRSERTAL